MSHTGAVWFESLTGFREDAVSNVAAQFVVDGAQITSKWNGRAMRCGRFETPTLGELRMRSGTAGKGGTLRLREVVASVRDLHADASNNGAFFQVASQFNTLEMASPSITPEAGVDGYERDLTQGPGCAIACGAGTIYRNYLVPLEGRAGQTATRQVNCLADLAAALGVVIEMRNGYALPTASQLERINGFLFEADEPTRDALMAHLRVGVQWDTEVTISRSRHTVTQAYCSALPVAYAAHPRELWQPFARLVLDAAYEASLAAAVLNHEATKSRSVFLTLLGGGAFGNDTPWIVSAIERALRIFARTDLDVAIVSYGTSNPNLSALLTPPASWADALFAERPRQWGLRGDPFLWNDLYAALRSMPPPSTSKDLEHLIGRELRRLCGVDVDTTDRESVSIERYRTVGMSGGHIAPRAWRARLVPLLVRRFVT